MYLTYFKPPKYGSPKSVFSPVLIIPLLMTVWACAGSFWLRKRLDNFHMHSHHDSRIRGTTSRWPDGIRPLLALWSQQINESVADFIVLYDLLQNCHRNCLCRNLWESHFIHGVWNKFRIDPQFKIVSRFVMKNYFQALTHTIMFLVHWNAIWNIPGSSPSLSWWSSPLAKCLL